LLNLALSHHSTSAKQDLQSTAAAADFTVIAQNKEIMRKWTVDKARAFKAYFSNKVGTASETSSSNGDVDNNKRSMSQTVI
jgi:hypothetical protein